MAELLVLLQNAWMRGALPGQRVYWPAHRITQKVLAEGLPRRAWLMALARSRTGKRLATMLPAGWALNGPEVWVDEASTRIGETPAAHFPIEMEHVLAVLDTQRPRAALLCGAEAGKAGPLCRALDIPVVEAPHPSFRLLTNERCAELRGELERVLSLAKGEMKNAESRRSPAGA